MIRIETNCQNVWIWKDWLRENWFTFVIFVFITVKVRPWIQIYRYVKITTLITIPCRSTSGLVLFLCDLLRFPCSTFSSSTGSLLFFIMLLSSCVTIKSPLTDSTIFVWNDNWIRTFFSSLVDFYSIWVTVIIVVFNCQTRFLFK